MSSDDSVIKTNVFCPRVILFCYSKGTARGVDRSPPPLNGLYCFSPSDFWITWTYNEGAPAHSGLFGLKADSETRKNLLSSRFPWEASFHTDRGSTAGQSAFSTGNLSRFLKRAGEGRGTGFEVSNWHPLLGLGQVCCLLSLTVICQCCPKSLQAGWQFLERLGSGCF